MIKNFKIVILISLLLILSSCQEIIDSYVDLAIISVIGPIAIVLFALIIGFLFSNKKK
jgi:hypothetical protein